MQDLQSWNQEVSEKLDEWATLLDPLLYPFIQQIRST